MSLEIILSACFIIIVVSVYTWALYTDRRLKKECDMQEIDQTIKERFPE